MTKTVQLRTAVAAVIFLAGTTLFSSCAKEDFSIEEQNPQVATYVENTEVTSTGDTQKSEGNDVTQSEMIENVTGNGFGEDDVYKRIMALKEQYPQRMTWTNDSIYFWNGGVFKSGKGCAAFAFILSDAAFGDLPAQKHTDFNKLKVGDVLCIDNAAHTVMVIGIDDKNITFAEGNIRFSANEVPYIYWGRKMSIEEVQNSLTFILTRYPAV